MYHCHICFYMIGHCRSIVEVLKKIPPLESFTHEFCASESPDCSLTAKADVLIANLQEGNAKEVAKELLSYKKENAELILLADQGQIVDLLGNFADTAGITDIWTLPMPEAELKFRFLKWQQTYKMQKDFWQTNHYLDAAMNHIPNLVWYKDKDGVHEKVNDSFLKTVQKTRQQVEGQRHAYIWDVEEDDPACIESENEVMRTEKTCVSEEMVKTKDGMRLLTTYKSPLYDLDGSVMGTVGVAIDITQERSYEQEIIQKNNTLEGIFRSLDCGVIHHSVDGLEIYGINQAALRILGYESEEELMKDGFDVIAPSVMKEDQPKLKDHIQELKREGDSVSVEYRVQHKDGEVLHIMGNIKLLKEEGRLFYQRFLLDCTAQKMLEKKQERRQMELIHALSIDYSLVGYFDLDVGGGIPLRMASEDPMFSEVFKEGVSLQEGMEEYIPKYVYKDDREPLRNAVSVERLKKELTVGKVFYMNFRVWVLDKMKYYQMKVVRTGTSEENWGIVAGFRNVDAEIRNEMEKKDLLEDALLQANKASKAKSIFLSNMSHDIRTPMNAIVGFTALAITHIDRKDQVKEYLNKIMSSGNHLLSLINDVLDMSRIESGKIHLDEKPCSLPDILHGLRNILQADIHAKQLELCIDAVDVIDEEICCDKLRLNQVLLNLLSNCVKYTGAGGIVSMRITEKRGVMAGYANYEFYIRDTGIGMSEEFVAHIFEPFERERSSTNSGIQGTGLGMAITKNIVDMMNGTIEVRSWQGVGTEFTVSFPFRLHSKEKEAYDIQELKNCRALVVDDDFNTCDSVSYMLQQIGMRAEWTLSGKEAILRTHQAAMRGDDYLVYIIDWLLPDMNGVEVTRRIRKEMGNEVSVIVLTAYDWSDIEEEAREAGVSAFCSKPLFLSELKSCLHSIIHEGKEGAIASLEKKEKVRTGRILLVEDNELNQEIAMAILTDAGFSADVASNGRQAVEILKESEPGYYQLVLMDVQMPVMNGYEAAREIRKLESSGIAKIPIIAMTANAFEEDKQEALKNGMNGHIAKPIDLDIFFETLDRILY